MGNLCLFGDDPRDFSEPGPSFHPSELLPTSIKCLLFWWKRYPKSFIFAQFSFLSLICIMFSGGLNVQRFDHFPIIVCPPISVFNLLATSLN
jgi:hypothetical protein